MPTPISEAVPMENIARSLSIALGERDHHTRTHCDRVVQLAAELGIHIELTADELDILSLGAQFHDIGKIGIPDKILRKPAAFESNEWACMKQHVEIGERIILAIENKKSRAVARVVRHHHEYFDGSGYPDRLVGTEIPLYARIISLADSYDAMAVTRPYHKARQHKAVMDILSSEAGTKHDPDLLHAFCAMIEKSELRATDD